MSQGIVSSNLTASESHVSRNYPIILCMYSLLKKPSAWIPIAIPLAFFVYVMTVATFFGVVREKDEGVGAHLFQLWLLLEPFMLGYFAFTWMPRAPKPALLILALQIVAAFLACAPVFYFKL